MEIVTLVTSIAACIATIITVAIAGMALKSQNETEELQRKMFESQKAMELIQQRINEQERLRRQSRARVALIHLEQIINHVRNWSAQYNITNELVSSIAGWPEEVAALPICGLRKRCEDLFQRVVMMPSHTVDEHQRFGIHSKLDDLLKEFQQLAQDCHTMINDDKW